MKKWGYGLSDLSEQQLVSCNTEMGGCIGGSSSAIKWWDEAHDNGPIGESCFPYTASDTTPCSYSCTELVTHVIDWHTVSEIDFRTSCFDEGPSYWRFTVYSDFAYNGRGYWYAAGPGDVYVTTEGFARGGHAVLLIGWDDNKGAYLCKNSWGATAGPNGDGTFWIAYNGHLHNLSFGMANFDLINNPQQECDYCLTDSLGYEWCLQVIGITGQAYYLTGTIDVGSYTLDAMATYVYNGTRLNMTALGGTVWSDFNYNTHFTTSTHATGNWVDEYGNYGQVGVVLVDSGLHAPSKTR